MSYDVGKGAHYIWMMFQLSEARLYVISMNDYVLVRKGDSEVLDVLVQYGADVTKEKIQFTISYSGSRPIERYGIWCIYFRCIEY